MNRIHSRTTTARTPRKGGPAGRDQSPRSGRPGQRGRASRWFLLSLCAAYLLAIVWTSVAYAMENKTAPRAALLSPLELPLRTVFTLRRRSDIRAYVQNQARASGVDPSAAAWIVAHESSIHPNATGDGGDSRGLWQINRVYHPEVSDRCAYDVQCSTRWSLERIRDGNINEWSTWKYRK